jgi:hypothetical protein
MPSPSPDFETWTRETFREISEGKSTKSDGKTGSGAATAGVNVTLLPLQSPFRLFWKAATTKKENKKPYHTLDTAK